MFEIHDGVARQSTPAAYYVACFDGLDLQVLMPGNIGKAFSSVLHLKTTYWVCSMQSPIHISKTIGPGPDSYKHSLHLSQSLSRLPPQASRTLWNDPNAGDVAAIHCSSSLPWRRSLYISPFVTQEESSRASGAETVFHEAQMGKFGSVDCACKKKGQNVAETGRNRDCAYVAFASKNNVTMLLIIRYKHLQGRRACKATSSTL